MRWCICIIPPPSLHCLKGLADNMFPGLGQHLDGHIVRNHVPLYQGTDEIVFRVGGSGKSQGSAREERKEDYERDSDQ